MKLVIDIPRKTYEHIRADGGHGYFNLWDEDNRIVTKAVFNSKPLPEHHGRLIDADELKKYKYHDSDRFENAVAVAQIDWAPTIIEAEGSDSE